MKTHLVFDIDRTLFDTNKFINLFSTSFKKYLDISPKKYEDVLSKYHDSLTKNTDYQPEEFIKHLINALNLDKKPLIHQKLKNLFFAKSNFTQSLFPDTIPALTDLKKFYTLGIYSEGFPAYQKAKLIKSGLIDLIDPRFIIIHRRKTKPEALSLLPKDCKVVDDNPDVITQLESQKNTSLTPIWINRKDSSRHPSARTIHTLTELV